MPHARDIPCAWCGAAVGDDCRTPKGWQTHRYHHVRVLGSLLGPQHAGAVAKVATMLKERQEATHEKAAEDDDAG